MAGFGEMVKVKFRGIGKTKTKEFAVFGSDAVGRWDSIAQNVYDTLMMFRKHDRTVQIVGFE